MESLTRGPVHIVDDEDAVRRSLGNMLAAAGFAVELYAFPQELLASAGRLIDGCVLADVRMPQMSGIELMRRLHALGVTLPFIIMTGHADVPLAVESMKAGAVDFIEKPFRREALLQALEQAFERADTPSFVAREQQRRTLEALPRRQSEVLTGILDGKLNKTIAFELGISVRTVEEYRAELMSKTGARSLSELIWLAFSAGIEPAFAVAS
ncbi:MAG TPA: response regulator [Caulobacteraceae bacterium]|nr:response regulator [Caulobacteraceae bacterium]